MLAGWLDGPEASGGVHVVEPHGGSLGRAGRPQGGHRPRQRRHRAGRPGARHRGAGGQAADHGCRTGAAEAVRRPRHLLPVDRRRQDHRLFREAPGQRGGDRPRDAEHPGRGRPRHHCLCRQCQRHRRPEDPGAPPAGGGRRGPGGRRRGRDRRGHRAVRRRPGLCVPADRDPGGRRSEGRPARGIRDEAGARDGVGLRRVGPPVRQSRPRSFASTSPRPAAPRPRP